MDLVKPKLVDGRGRGAGAAGAATSNFCKAVDRADKGVCLVGDVEVEFDEGCEVVLDGLAFSVERREDVTSDFLGMVPEMTHFEFEFEGPMVSDEDGTALHPVEEESVAYNPGPDEDALLTLRFAASLVNGAFDLTLGLTLPLILGLGFKGEGRRGVWIGLEGRAAANAETARDERGPRTRAVDELDGMGIRDLVGELCPAVAKGPKDDEESGAGLDGMVASPLSDVL